MHRRRSWLDRPAARARAAGRALSARAVPQIPTAAALILLSAAAWWFAVPAGLAAAGLSILVLEWRIRG
jgi:hypothetical protein